MQLHAPEQTSSEAALMVPEISHSRAALADYTVH